MPTGIAPLHLSPTPVIADTDSARQGYVAHKLRVFAHVIGQRESSTHPGRKRLSLMGGDNINTPRASATARAGCHRGSAMNIATWWLRWYLESVSLAAHMTGANPDYDKVRADVMRGVRVKA